MDKKQARLRRARRARARIAVLELRGSIANGGNMAAAAAVGEAIAKRAAAAGISAVAFDRSGYKFHGRGKALADAAREHGLEF